MRHTDEPRRLFQSVHALHRDNRDVGGVTIRFFLKANVTQMQHSRNDAKQPPPSLPVKSHRSERRERLCKSGGVCGFCVGATRSSTQPSRYKIKRGTAAQAPRGSVCGDARRTCYQLVEYMVGAFARRVAHDAHFF